MASKDHFPKPGEIDWSKVKEYRVSSNDNAYSFEFDVDGKRQRMTLVVAPDSVQLTVADEQGNPLATATQKHDELSLVDFTTRPALPSWLKKMQMRPKKGT